MEALVTGIVVVAVIVLGTLGAVHEEPALLQKVNPDDKA